MAGTITTLSFQKRNRERVNVHLDGRFAFALSAVLAASLKRGQHLTDEEVAELTARDDRERAYENALRFLAYRPRSAAEVRGHLHKRNLPEPVVDAVIQRLLDADYLDDEAFARFWVSNREQFNPRGPLALRYELRQKGVSEEIIEQVLYSVDDEHSAYKAGAAQARRLRTQEEPIFRRKLQSYLLRRGFNYDVARTVVEQLWLEQQGES